MLASILGTLPQWLTVVALLATGWLITRGSAGPALGYEREANRTLRERNTELEKELKDAHVEVATLRAKTDLAPMQDAIMEHLQAHEDRAQERFEQTTNVLGLIADRLGPES